jgi:hypothetical protein
MSEPIISSGSRLSKLRAMSGREILHRLQYKTLLTLERRQHKRNALAPADRLRRALRPELQRADWQSALVAARRESTGRFYPGIQAPDAMRQLFSKQFSTEGDKARHHAALARAHRFEFFGQEFTYGHEIDWQADPVTGRRWPDRYHADVHVHVGDVGCGDVKHVWELSRQQYVMDLGKAYFLFGTRDDLVALQQLVRSWIAGNPYATGVNWSCALEPAFRAWSWLWAYHFTAHGLDDAFHLEWLTSLYDHGRFLARHLEHYSSPYNHLIGEAAALYALGLCFPEFREARAWSRLGRRVLERRLDEQFYTDGGSVEQSMFYHHATLGFYLLAGLIGRANGDELGSAVWAAVERGLVFSMMLMQPDGRTPEIGGADDGKPIRLEHLPFWDFRPYQAAGAVLFRRGDFKRTAGRFYEDALWLLGPAALQAFEFLESRIPNTNDALFSASGYAVARSDWSSDADYVCVDIGEQAAGMRTDAVPNSMHGHADCLSVIAWLGGRRALVDSGLFAYNCGGEWEAHFRETAAHNTARIDGRDQARHLGKMAWSHSYRARVEGRLAATDQNWVVGSHDGYARGPNGVTHRRVVWRRQRGYIVIYDEFEGSGVHEIEVNFQFAPGSLERPDGARVVFDGFAEMAWAGSGTWHCETQRGGPRPQDGWICPSLGVRQPAPRVSLRNLQAQPRACLVTVLADSRRVRRPITLVSQGGGGTLFGIATGTGTDWIAAAGLSEGTPFDTDSRLVISHVGRDGRVTSNQVQGSYLRVDVAALRALATSVGDSAA